MKQKHFWKLLFQTLKKSENQANDFWNRNILTNFTVFNRKLAEN